MTSLGNIKCHNIRQRDWQKLETNISKNRAQKVLPVKHSTQFIKLTSDCYCETVCYNLLALNYFYK